MHVAVQRVVQAGRESLGCPGLSQLVERTGRIHRLRREIAGSAPVVIRLRTTTGDGPSDERLLHVKRMQLAGLVGES